MVILMVTAAPLRVRLDSPSLCSAVHLLIQAAITRCVRINTPKPVREQAEVIWKREHERTWQPSFHQTSERTRSAGRRWGPDKRWPVKEPKDDVQWHLSRKPPSGAHRVWVSGSACIVLVFNTNILVYILNSKSECLYFLCCLSDY